MKGRVPVVRRWRRSALFLVTLLALALLVSGQPLPMQASSPANTLDVLLQVEGYIREQNPGMWRIGDAYVAVDQNTTIDQKVAPAELYAYVMVAATHLDGRPPHADIITVSRAASKAGPKEISGTLVKRGAPENGVADWSVSGTLVLITNETVITGQPTDLCLLTVLAEDRSGILYALEVDVIAGQPSAVPVEFQGVVSSVDPSGASWVMDGSTVYSDGQTVFMNGVPVVGQTVEVRAGLSGNGHLLATLVHVKTAPATAALGAYVVSIQNQPAGAQEWNVIVFPAGSGTSPVPATLHVDQKTWIDRSRALPGTGKWAEIRAVQTGNGTYRAETIRLTRPAKLNFRAKLQPVGPKAGTGQWMRANNRSVWLSDGAANGMLTANLAIAGNEATVDGLLLGNGVVWAERIGR